MTSSVTATTARPPRRTQAERRSATRAKLLDAAISCLVERGYNDTTTTEVCREAGVSQGALFKHFATKADLLAAAAERLFASLVDDYREGFAAFPVERRVTGAIELLWSVFERPKLHAAFELYVAARTDAELAGRLAPVAAAHRENLHRLARNLFADAADPERFSVLVDFVIDAFQGARLGALAAPREDRERLIRFASKMAEEALA